MPLTRLRLCHARIAARAAAVSVVAFMPPSLAGQQPARQPDVYLATLTTGAGGLRVGAPANVTAREGYDNQPSFSPDGASLYFTSVREDAQADIYRFDIATGATSRITTSAPESEYSAQVLPDGSGIAVIRVERDSTQRLWRVDRDGRNARILLDGVRPAGYFAFADAHTVALFVLGRPPTLQLSDLRRGNADTIVANIGRSLHRIPGSRRISYVSRAYEGVGWIMSLDPDTRSPLPIARLPEGAEDYAWLPDGRLIAGQGTRLLVCNPATTAAWVEVADLSDAGLSSITRLAVSPAGDRLAIVAVPSR